MSQHEIDKRPPPRQTVRRLWAERFPEARVLFCGGSVIRGEGKASSDLDDVVVLFEHLHHAWRESFYFGGWPVEVFAHDPETLTYFVEADVKRGRPSLAQMIAEALVIPEPNDWSQAIQLWAKAIISSQPKATSPEEVATERYTVTDLLNDFRDDRPRSELVAIACRLYPEASNLLLRSQSLWLGAGKTLPKLTAAAAPDLARALEDGFEQFFQNGHRDAASRAVELVLEPLGGELFADAPRSWRVAASEVPWLGDGARKK